jgi:putative redox protein
LKIEGDRAPGVDPSLWKNITIIFELEGEIDREKAEKACALSLEKYCSVSETLKRAGAEINWKVDIL